MRWPRFSRIGSRRSLRSVLVVAWLIAGVVLGYGQISHTTQVAVTDTYIQVSVFTAIPEVSDVVPTIRENLAQGLKAQVEYVVRVVQPRRRPFRVFGDRLIGEFRQTMGVQIDPFLDRYVITGDDGGRYTFTEWSEMVDFLLSLRQYRIPWTVLSASSTGIVPGPFAPALAVETQVIITPVVFVPALGILSLLRASDREYSAVVRVGIHKSDTLTLKDSR